MTKLGWQSFDRLCYILAYGTEKQLENFVAKPEVFVETREDLPIAASDAVPVYLDISTGKILVSTSVLDAAAKRRLAKKKGQEPEELTENVHIIAEGASRQDKDRLTWICRQICYNYFKKGSKEKPAPRIRGDMLSSILLVHCSTFCRVENICPETDTWLEDEEFWLNGVHTVRKAGDKVPATLMRPWRDLREREPELFEKGVLVWGSLNAYQNEVVCAAQSKLLEKECPNGCLHQVDMFSGELTEIMEAINFLRHQPKTVVPPKQTSKAQVTDLGLARMGKAAGNKEKRRLRILQKRVASRKGEAAKHESGPYECLSICVAMHQRCVEAASVGFVEESFRKSAWLAYDFLEEGMKPAEGERWANLPLGGTNYPSKYMEQRYGHTDEAGVPVRPDWGELHEFRRKQRESKKDDDKIKAAGRAAWLEPKVGRAKVLADAQEEKERREEEALQTEREHVWSEKDACLGVLSEYLTQEDISEEPKSKEQEGEEDVRIELSTWKGLEEKQDEAWFALPPKRRREILEEARTECLSVSQGGESTAEKEMLKETAEVFPYKYKPYKYINRLKGLKG